MRILLLCHSFNSLSQRLHVELTRQGHDLSVEFDINDAITESAVRLFQPELILAPFLKRAIPASVWTQVPCFIVHPGIPGDRGPSALDWAIQRGETEWGVTVLLADAELDAGPVLASRPFTLRCAPKSSQYRSELTDAACAAVHEALMRWQAGERGAPVPGQWHPFMPQAARRSDWHTDRSSDILRHLHAADGHPGVLDCIAGKPVYLYAAHPESELRGPPGALLARRHGAICRATVDGAIWIGQLRAADGTGTTLKRPAVDVLGDVALALPELPSPPELKLGQATYRDLFFQISDAVGYLYFPFHNGAMTSEHCLRLRDAYRELRNHAVKVIVLMGGEDFFCNGIHLHVIEASASPADASWQTINAMNDLVLEILTNDQQLTVSALRGNAAAGGVFLALAADRVIAHTGVVLNPHYRNMGNLYGSEYWTYVLPHRVGPQAAQQIMAQRLPLGAPEAAAMGLLDACFDSRNRQFEADIQHYATALAQQPDFAHQLQAKRTRRARDEAAKPLAVYREEELAEMALNFYGFDPSYHVARYHFVTRRPHAWTPLYLARHRQ